MTFEDSEETQQLYDNGNMVQIGSAVHDCLLDAQAEGRIIYGLNASCEFLEMNANAVMVCILPENVANDITMHIHLTLIEAFCWENEIRLIKVDSAEKLANLLDQPSTHHHESGPTAQKSRGLNTADVDCILIAHPKKRSSVADDDVLEFCKLTSNAHPQPIVELVI